MCEKHAFHTSGWNLQLAIEVVACVATTFVVLLALATCITRLSFKKKMRSVRQKYGDNTQIVGFFHPNW